MKAFYVRYDVPGRSGNRIILLAPSEEEVPDYLKHKDGEYNSNKRFAHLFKIHAIDERPFSQVKISDLSIQEFLWITKGKDLE